MVPNIMLRAPMQGVQIGANGQMTGYALGSSVPSYMDSSGFTAPQTSSAQASASGGMSAWGGASIGLAIGQAIGNIYGAFSSASTTKHVLKRQAEIAESNRQMAQLSAESAFRQGEGQIAQLTYRAGQIKGAQRTGYAASGVRLDSGSASEVMASTDVMKGLDVATTRMNALSAAWGFRNQALQASASGATFRGMASATSGLGTAVGSLLEGGTEVASRWYKYFGEA